MRQAKELAEKAMSLDPNSAEAYLMLGAAEVFNRDWRRAEELMRHSLGQTLGQTLAQRGSHRSSPAVRTVR